MGIDANILTLRQKKRLSAEELAEQIGVSKQMIYQYEKGISRPGKEKLALLAKALDVSVPDLFSDDLQENHTRASENRSVYLKPSPGEARLIPFYDVVAVGGRAMLADQQATSNPVEYIDPGTFLRTATGSLRVYGHSMFPKYPAGCIVAYKQADPDVIIWGEDYVIELEDRRIIKRIEKGEVKDIVRAVSYNKSEEYAYGVIDLPKGKIKRLFMVLGKIELEASI